MHYNQPYALFFNDALNMYFLIEKNIILSSNCDLDYDHKDKDENPDPYQCPTSITTLGIIMISKRAPKTTFHNLVANGFTIIITARGKRMYCEGRF